MISFRFLLFWYGYIIDRMFCHGNICKHKQNVTYITFLYGLFLSLGITWSLMKKMYGYMVNDIHLFSNESFKILIFIPILALKAKSPQTSCMTMSFIIMYFRMYLMKSNRNEIYMVDHFSLTLKRVALSCKPFAWHASPLKNVVTLCHQLYKASSWVTNVNPKMRAMHTSLCWRLIPLNLCALVHFQLKLQSVVCCLC